MSLRKYTRAEKVDVVPEDEQQRIASYLTKVGKRSAAELSAEQREELRAETA